MEPNIQHYPFVVLDDYVIMPNHIHGIIVIDKHHVKTQNVASQQYHPHEKSKTQNVTSLPRNQFGPQSQNLASIMRGYKAAIKKYAVMKGIKFEWQSRYYDHIIGNEKSFIRIKYHIVNYPLKWNKDRYYK